MDRRGSIRKTTSYAGVFPVAKAGKPRKYHIAGQPPVSAEAALPTPKGKRSVGGGERKGGSHVSSRLDVSRVADGHKHRNLF